MTFRDSYPELDLEDGSGAEALRKRGMPLFTVMIGLLATMNVVSVVFVLLH
ncbi:hypothetical protein [Microvirga terrestris]|uniref:Uncharacterized protein n=1 Tax=Microvirga terrestris TaxID=2791024 RepID=A0ABS0HMX4_9HYPH|nr:hypothetical protein [Microvirga terrestris]MBF9194826.1 hypothetical protein [Microvirga terrestris]